MEQLVGCDGGSLIGGGGCFDPPLQSLFNDTGGKGMLFDKIS